MGNVDSRIEAGTRGEGHKRGNGDKKSKKRSVPVIADQDALLLKTAATYSPALWCSTIGVPGLNFSVRNGKRWNPRALCHLNIP